MAVVTKSFTATGQSSAFQPIMRNRSWGQFNIEIRGTFVGTVALERALDSTNWVGVTTLGSAVSWTAPASETWEENEAGAQYRLNCTAYTSGTITCRFSQ